MHALSERLDSLRADLLARTRVSPGSLFLAISRTGIPHWRLLASKEQTFKTEFLHEFDSITLHPSWKALARQAAETGLRYLAAGPDHRLILGAKAFHFEASDCPGGIPEETISLTQVLLEANLAPGRLTVLGGPARGHGRLAAFDAVSRWAEAHDLPAPDSTRLPADWWITPGAAMRRGPLVATFVLEDPERTRLFRIAED